MEDANIIDLYWKRDEKAIRETQRRYKPYCSRIAWRMLENHQDVQECLNDTWLGAWNTMPPHRPSCLRTFLGKITRNLALKRLESCPRPKSGAGEKPGWCWKNWSTVWQLPMRWRGRWRIRSMRSGWRWCWKNSCAVCQSRLGYCFCAGIGISAPFGRWPNRKGSVKGQ